ncbi:sigma-70 family RNA polymerase sigma factor [Streptomyces sp. NPDC098781]|uniref:sigma-70 family RNA polymerase sigma factor n=1 Tax=Streptomyces sp. NPDC098781 TaxID=3366097 RepID=UPI003800988C
MDAGAGMRTLPPTGTQRPTEAPGTDCEEFIRDLYKQHGALLLRYAARLLGGDWHRAEDILQETAARAWRHSAILGADAEEARPWLFTVVRNLVIDHHRARQIRPSELMSLDDLEVAVADDMERMLTTQVIVEALGQLTEQHQEIIKLMYFLECSVAQVSEHLGIPPGTVKSRSYYAVRSLRNALEERGVRGT